MNAPAERLQLPLYHPVLQEVDGFAPFQPLPDGLTIAGTPEDYIRLTLQGDGTAQCIPALFCNANIPDYYDEIASRMMFALHSQYGNNWGMISGRAFIKAMVDEANARVAARPKASAAQHNTDPRSDRSLLEEVLNGLRRLGSSSGSSAPLTREELQLPEYHFLPSPLATFGLNTQRLVNDTLIDMVNDDMLGANEQNYFWPTKKLLRELNAFFNPVFPS